MSSVAALVPLRAPGAGKTRLAARLSREERAALVGAMLADVVAALRAAPVTAVVVAARGAEAAAAAAALGVRVVVDPPGVVGLSAAVDRAARVLAAGGQGLLIAAADLPCLTPGDVEAMLARPEAVVVAPTSDGGTGGLLRRPASVVPAAYGPQSGDRHLRLASAAGVDGVRLDLAGFRHDVDTIDDLRAVAARGVGPATAAFLDRLRPTG